MPIKLSGSTSGSVTVQAPAVAGTNTLTLPAATGNLLSDQSIVPGSSSVPTNGMYLPATNALGFATNSTNAMYIDASQNVGIGTSSPATKLNVYTGSATNTFLRVNNTVGTIDFGVLSTGEAYGGFATGTVYYGTSGANPAVFYTTNSERMRIDSSGNVGIGTTSPSSKLTVAGNGNYTGALDVVTSTAAAYGLRIIADSANTYAGIQFTNNPVTAPLGYYRMPASNVHAWYDSTPTERMRIGPNGELLIGTTVTNATNTTGVAILSPASSTAVVIGHITGTATGTSYLYMSYNGTGIGSITQNGTTAVSFNTSSDYRLKENVTPMTVGLATISALKPVTYDWVGTNENGEGFVAHELQEVIPHAVTGVKDAVNEDGSIKPQGVDYSKIVVHLVKAIQELSAKNDALEARLVALEAK